MIQIRNVQVPLSYDTEKLYGIAAKKLGVSRSDLQRVEILKKSVDARKRDQVRFVMTLGAELENEAAVLRRHAKDNDIALYAPQHYAVNLMCYHMEPPVIVGSGPAGLFAAHLLARQGVRPILLERGQPVDQRRADVMKFWSGGVLDPESNVQFGEGGAGTFSDGKLNTGTKDYRARHVLETFVQCGAPSEILIQAKPHIGTDRLIDTVRTMREQIIQMGGQVLFGAKFTDFACDDQGICSVSYTCGGEVRTIATRRLILAVGHSARDVFSLLKERGVALAQKNFAVGVRIEHLQRDINDALYGKFASHPALSAADYKLVTHLPNGHSLYTFCMCPGGQVVAAASEENRLVTNGMSLYARDSVNANSALLVGVDPAMFGSDDPLAGVAFQRELESAAFSAGGGSYRAPLALVGDFLEGKRSSSLGRIQPTYQPGYTFVRPEEYLPAFICDTLRDGLPRLGRMIRGFDCGDAILTGVESRSSSPVRILRDETCMSVTHRGLFPCGEGAGYAGGIVSAAVDGLRCAEAALADI